MELLDAKAIALLELGCLRPSFVVHRLKKKNYCNVAPPHTHHKQPTDRQRDRHADRDRQKHTNTGKREEARTNETRGWLKTESPPFFYATHKKRDPGGGKPRHSQAKEKENMTDRDGF